MRLTVTDVHREDFGESVVRFVGDDGEGNDEVVFAVDHRPALDLVQALDAGVVPEVEVESLQILSTTPTVYDVLNDERVVARTKTGKVLTEADFDRLADEAEEGHDQ